MELGGEEGHCTWDATGVCQELKFSGVPWMYEIQMVRNLVGRWLVEEKLQALPEISLMNVTSLQLERTKAQHVALLVSFIVW